MISSRSLHTNNALKVNSKCSLKLGFEYGFGVFLFKNPKIMFKKLPKQPQLEKFKTILISFINPERELCLPAKKID
jgi:hypothetical protein